MKLYPKNAYKDTNNPPDRNISLYGVIDYAAGK